MRGHRKGEMDCLPITGGAVNQSQMDFYSPIPRKMQRFKPGRARNSTREASILRMASRRESPSFGCILTTFQANRLTVGAKVVHRRRAAIRLRKVM